ncbi:MAG: hypothetical protein EYC70_05605 [Planctomycetota bacterium]|nr:MAG: hypothetical protein EYC70_05605 [Planctomycetota bacterium]
MLSTLVVLTALAAPQQPARILADASWDLRRQQQSLRERRVLDPATGRIRAAGWLADGSSADAAALRTEEQRRTVDSRRGISADLAAQLAARAPEVGVDVVFWLRTSARTDLASVLRAAEATGASGEDARRAAHAAALAACAEVNADFARRLDRAGMEVLYVADAWPNVFARMPAGEVAAWAGDPAVDMAYYCFPHWAPEMDHAQRAMRTPTVWNRGITCGSSTVKVLVNDVGDVVRTNPYLPPIILLTTLGVDSHATGVAGNIVLDHPDLQAAAHDLPALYSGAGDGDAHAPQVWSAAIAQGVSFGNCSWWNFHRGSIAYLDRFFDYTIRNFGVMMFKSNGNQGETSEPYSTTPGNGYNMISTGAFSDFNTSVWEDDRMASYSSYWDPVEGHEKPELASPGDGVATAGILGPGWTQSSFGGTSSASPLVCGVATLLATREPQLKTHPEVVKAVLMVSAWENLEGDDLLSEKDGAGGVDAAAADAVLRDRQLLRDVLTPASFSNDVYDVPFLAYAGDETRVIALWLSSADSAYSTDFLDMDLDAAVLDPHGLVAAASANTMNPYELLKFVPAETGMHTLRLSRIRFNGVSEPLCVAWSSRLDAAVGAVSITGTPTLGETVTVVFEDAYDPFVYYQAHASSGTLPNVTPLLPGTALPLLHDSVYDASASWSGFRGILGPQGRAFAAVTIPAAPALAGRSYYIAFYTSRGGKLRGISEALAVTLQP